MKPVAFQSEADLCDAFAESARAAGWIVYPETAGFDMLLVRPEGDAHAGVQIGVQAKKTLNAKVADQILPYVPYDSAWERGPDYLAVLVGSVGGAAGITQLLRRCGVAVIEPQQRLREGITLGQWYWPVGPQDRRSIWRLWGDASAWTDWNPTQRCELPRFVPNVRAGVPSPLQLTPWKVAALRVVVQLEIAGDVSAAEIKRLGCDPSRWCRADTRWLDPAGPGRFVRSDRLPRFELQHPAEYAQLLAEARGVSA